MIWSDNEPALLQIFDKALMALKAKGVTSSSEGSVPYDPQTSGAAENAVRLLKGSLRANLLSFERQNQARIPVNHPILAWLVSYAASIPSRQMCRFKAGSEEKGIGPHMTRWSIRVYICIERRTGQYVIYGHKSERVHHARNIAQVPAPAK